MTRAALVLSMLIGACASTDADLGKDDKSAVVSPEAVWPGGDSRDTRNFKSTVLSDTRPLPAKELAGLSEDEVLARHRRVVVRVY